MSNHHFEKTSSRTRIAAGLLVSFLLALGSWSCSPEGYPGKVETITFGTPPLEQNALIYIADEQRLFARNGLKIVFKDYDSGVTAIDGMLKGEVDIAEAEDYLTRHPDKARAIVQKRLNYDDAYIASVWPQHQFSLSLDFSLLVAMNDEARWIIDNNLTTEKQIPNFFDHVYLDGLRTAKPAAVNIGR